MYVHRNVIKKKEGLRGGGDEYLGQASDSLVSGTDSPPASFDEHLQTTENTHTHTSLLLVQPR